MATFFTSDTHYFHKKMLELRKFDTLGDMHESMIGAWNDYVRPYDTVYHLGDVSFGGTKRTQEIFENLNGSVIVIPGNHDRALKFDKLHTRHGQVKELPQLVEVKVATHRLDGTTDVQRIVLCHNSLRTWNRAHHGTYHLYGHSHGTLPGLGKSMDVGVDAVGLAPISFEAVHFLLKDKAYVQLDQHEETTP